MNAKTLWVFAITLIAVFMTTLDNLVVTSAIAVIPSQALDTASRKADSGGEEVPVARVSASGR